MTLETTYIDTAQNATRGAARLTSAGLTARRRSRSEQSPEPESKPEPVVSYGIYEDDAGYFYACRLLDGEIDGYTVIDGRQVWSLAEGSRRFDTLTYAPLRNRWGTLQIHGDSLTPWAQPATVPATVLTLTTGITAEDLYGNYERLDCEPLSVWTAADNDLTGWIQEQQLAGNAEPVELDIEAHYQDDYIYRCTTLLDLSRPILPISTGRLIADHVGRLMGLLDDGRHSLQLDNLTRHANRYQIGHEREDVKPFPYTPLTAPSRAPVRLVYSADRQIVTAEPVKPVRSARISRRSARLAPSRRPIARRHRPQPSGRRIQTRLAAQSRRFAVTYRKPAPKPAPAPAPIARRTPGRFGRWHRSNGIPSSFRGVATSH